MTLTDQESKTKGELTRKRIIDAAYQLFLEQGYHGTSMRQIVDKTSITMGGIYNHFASKEEIWQAVFYAKHPYHEIMPFLLEAHGDTIEEFIRDGARRLVTELGRRDDLLNLMFIEIVEFQGKNIPDIFSFIQRDGQKIRDAFTQKSGDLRDIPLPIVARSFAGFFFSYYITSVFIPKHMLEFLGDKSLEYFIDIYLHGILNSSKEA